MCPFESCTDCCIQGLLLSALLGGSSQVGSSHLTILDQPLISVRLVCMWWPCWLGEGGLLPGQLGVGHAQSAWSNSSCVRTLSRFWGFMFLPFALSFAPKGLWSPHTAPNTPDIPPSSLLPRLLLICPVACLLSLLDARQTSILGVTGPKLESRASHRSSIV